MRLTGAPAPLSDLFKKEYLAAPYTDLLDQCDQCFETIAEQAQVIKENSKVKGVVSAKVRAHNSINTQGNSTQQYFPTISVSNYVHMLP